MNRILIGCIVGLLSLIAAFGAGARVGRDHQIAKLATTEQLIRAADDHTMQVVADALAKMTPIQKTIHQKTETVIREVPVYRDCVNDPAVERLLDAARANREPDQSISSRGLPEAGSDITSHVR